MPASQKGISFWTCKQTKSDDATISYNVIKKLFLAETVQRLARRIACKYK